MYGAIEFESKTLRCYETGNNFSAILRSGTSVDCYQNAKSSKKKIIGMFRKLKIIIYYKSKQTKPKHQSEQKSNKHLHFP